MIIRGEEVKPTKGTNSLLGGKTDTWILIPGFITDTASADSQTI